MITGFLGSGKTTVIKGLLEHPDSRGIAVLVNEVGEIGLDHHLLETVEEDVLLMAGGCICCALRDDLRGLVREVLERGAHRIVLETTGLADPAPVLHTFATDAWLREHLVLAGVICLVDAARAEDLLAAHPEARRQLDFADRVLVTKTDQVEPGRLDTVLEHVARRAAGREVRFANHGQLDPAWLLSAGGTRRGPRFHAAAWLRSGHQGLRTHTVLHHGRSRLDQVLLWLRLVTQVDGTTLLRIKGIVRDEHGAWLVQSAGRAVSQPIQLPGYPGERAEMVILERGLPDSAVAPLLASLEDALGA